MQKVLSGGKHSVLTFVFGLGTVLLNSSFKMVATDGQCEGTETFLPTPESNGALPTAASGHDLDPCGHPGEREGVNWENWHENKASGLIDH